MAHWRHGNRGAGRGSRGPAGASEWPRGARGWLTLLGVSLSIALALGFAGPAFAGQGAGAPAPAKNIILLIGDGMGDSEITIARNYSVGAAGRLALDTLPMTGTYTTYAVQESNPQLPNYASESGSTSTAWSTGSKTSNGRIGTAAGTDADLKSIMDIAQERGMVTGNVSTAEITDATPAGMMAHVVSRTCQGPQDMASCPQDRKAAGGPGSIAEQSVDHQIDVILGGGRQRFEQTIDGGPYAGKTVTQSARDQGYAVVTDANGLQGAQPGTKLLGLFNNGNMTLEWKGALADTGAGSGPQRCQENQRPANEPGIDQMTSKAIALLGARVTPSGPGFFLQVEGASIDKQDHAANPCGQIGETVAFDRAVKVALDYAATRTDTLVIVTADHAHTSQIIAVDAETPGLSSTLTTNEGVPMRINYGTAIKGQSQEHTGSQVRIAARGPQAEAVIGVLDQTDLFRIMNGAIGAGPAAPMPGLPNTGAGWAARLPMLWAAAALLLALGTGVGARRYRRRKGA